MPNSVTFDLNSAYLGLFNNGALLYKTRDGHVHLENRGGFLNAICRLFYAIIGVKEYRLNRIVPGLATQEPSTLIQTKNIEWLNGKLAKKYGIKPEILEIFKKAVADPAVTQFCTGVKKDDLKKLAEFKKASLSAPAVQAVLDKATAIKKFKEVGLDTSLIDKDLDGACFLVRSRLIYSIVGFRSSSAQGAENHDIKVHPKNNTLLIKMEGEWVAAKDLAKELVLSEEDGISLINKTNSKLHWLYTSPYGLMPIDRYRTPQMYPVERLSKGEMETLLEHANSFNGKRIEMEENKDLPRSCVIQIITHPRHLTSHDDSWLLSNFSAQVPVHAGIRIISSDGKVYSTGFGSTIEEDKYSIGLRNYAASINGMPTILDYEEFRQHEGRVSTSIAITEKDFKAVLEHLNEFRKKTIRFNILQQNCTYLAKYCLLMAGVKVENKVPIKKLFSNVLPGITPQRIKRIGEAFKKKIHPISNCRAAQFAKKVCSMLTNILLFIPRLIATFIVNILILCLGGNKGSPVPDEIHFPDDLEAKEEMQEFSRVLTRARDLFSDEKGQIYHSFPLVQWQLKQQSTFVHAYSGKPSMSITLPAAGTELFEKSKKRQEYFHKKFVTNFT